MHQTIIKIYIYIFFFHPTGDLGKELKNLITLMDQEEEAAQRTVSQKKNLKIQLI